MNHDSLFPSLALLPGPFGGRHRRAAWIACGVFGFLITVAAISVGAVAFDQMLTWDPWIPRPDVMRIHRPRLAPRVAVPWCQAQP